MENSKVLSEQEVHQLAIALWHAGNFDGAAALLKRALGGLTFACGAHHPATLAAKGDLASVLFELGRDVEAGSLELEAFESARAHLGKTHTVRSVLAWNRVLNCESRGDFESARQVLADELSWLLAEDPSSLEADQTIVRSLLSDRFRWDSAPAC